MSFLLGLWNKLAFKIALAIALALVCYFRAIAWRDAAVTAERNRLIALASVKDTTTHQTPTTQPEPILIEVPAAPDTVQDPRLKAIVDSLERVNRNLKYELAQNRTATTPFRTQASLIGYGDQLSITGTATQTFNPLQNRFGLTLALNPLTVPVKEITNTKYIPVTEHWIDLYAREGLYAYLDRPLQNGAGITDVGVILRCNQLELQAGVGFVYAQQDARSMGSISAQWVFTK